MSRSDHHRGHRDSQSTNQNGIFEHIQKHGQRKQGIQGHLSSNCFADTMPGRALDALEKGVCISNVQASASKQVTA